MKALITQLIVFVALQTGFGQLIQNEVTSTRGRMQYYSGVVGTSGNLGYSIRSDQGGGWAWQFVDNLNNPFFHVQYPTGNVGIGSGSPSHKLTIEGQAAGSETQVNIYNPSNLDGAVAGIRFHAGNGWNVMLRTKQNSSWLELTDNVGEVAHSWTGGNYFATGKIAIGTMDIPGSHLLYVNGSAIATEVIVKLKGAWPDYVFENNYRLPSLSEVEQYIKTNKRLPEAPSEKEVKENGLSLGEMNAVLLKKVEELTLYLIEQNKKIEVQQNQIAELQHKIR